MATAKCNRIDARIASKRVRLSRFRSIKTMAQRRTRSADEALLAPSSHHASSGRISQRFSSHKSGRAITPKESQMGPGLWLDRFPMRLSTGGRNSFRARGISQTFSHSLPPHTRVMKQVLLRVTTLRAKIACRELSQCLRRHCRLCSEILFAQYPLDPDVNRKRTGPLVGEQHHAVCDLCPDTRQIA